MKNLFPRYLGQQWPPSESTAVERNDWMIHPWESILQQLPLIREMKIFLDNKETKFYVFTPNTIEVWTSELFRLMGGQVFPTDTFVDISEVSGTREPDELMGSWIQSLLLIVETAW